MIFRTLSRTLLAGALIAGSTYAAPDEELRGKIEAWVDTLRQIQKEEADWDVEKQILLR